MLQEDMVVRIVRGPWKGHLGLLTGLPEYDPTVAWVAISRPAPQGRHGERGSVPIMPTYVVRRADIEPYR